jgi:thiamine biosynthesis protein ThiI
MTILVAYSEIALKGNYVRRRLERLLADQISFKLNQNGYSGFKILRRFGRIYIENIPDEASKHVAKVFGVASVMPAEKTDSKLESVINLAIEVAKRKLKKGESFALRTRVIGRAREQYSSRDLAVKGGSSILEQLKEINIHVNLNNPDLTIHLEVRDRDAFAYTEIQPGVIGLPYGSQGKMVSLFSGGIDSPVATWMMMKRGASVYPLFMDQRPHVGESYLKRAESALEFLKEYAPTKEFKMHIAPISEVMNKILESPDPRFRCILCKRSMYRIAEAFAEFKKAKALITGESLGQVASQTLDNLYVLNSAVKIPIFRPNIGLDKVEIEAIARKIGTYKITAKNVEGCTVVPRQPATKSTINKILKLEEKLELYDKCMDSVKNIKEKKFDKIYAPNSI